MSNNSTLFRLETKDETKVISAYSEYVIMITIESNWPQSSHWLVHLYDNNKDVIPFASYTADKFMLYADKYANVTETEI